MWNKRSPESIIVQTRIKEYRTRLNLTQDDLAKKVGVRRETIVFLEQGKYNPSLKLSHDVARTLHTTIDNLFIFEDEVQGQESGIVLEE
jgi:putative transcriptional regulator